MFNGKIYIVFIKLCLLYFLVVLEDYIFRKEIVFIFKIFHIITQKLVTVVIAVRVHTYKQIASLIDSLTQKRREVSF